MDNKPNTMHPTPISFEGEQYLVSFHYDGNRRIVTVEPSNEALKADVIRQLDAGTFKIKMGRAVSGPHTLA